MHKILAGISIASILVMGSPFSSGNNQSNLTGAWSAKNGSIDHVLIFQDGYFSYSVYDKVNRKFIRSWGGTFTESGGQMHANIEFDTESKDNVGGHKHFASSISGNSLKLDMGGGINSWTKIDDGSTNLAGNWRITGRMRDGTIQPIQKSPRKTLKILSSTRFQWMAINTETKEFFGTGGGTYTFKDGKYTENIEFFSRDSTRVGASLSFDGSVSSNVWTHKGLSSRGEPIHEEWTREK
ncbi:MAG TPA: hypothetical protein VFP97_15475 [Chitinophagaceae bacterium]|nr:hypothetical protein [Chitinophagaceae bacterium]